MASEEPKITFICRNYSCSYEAGKLKLPFAFFLKYGSKLPKKVYLHVPSTAIWTGEISKDLHFIEGLDEMMAFHNVKEYHIVLLEYRGGGNFKVEIFNPYCVEINYDLDHKVRLCEVASASITENVLFKDLEVAKLFECYRYNAYHNFVGIYKLRIPAANLNGQSYRKVFSEEACSALNLTESVDSISLCFNKFKWNIHLKWVNDEVYFEKGWNEFVEECGIGEGDLVVFSKKLSANSFRVVLFSDNFVSLSNPPTVSAGSIWFPKFFKLTKKSTIEDAELEFPLVFVEKYGKSLSRNIQVDLGRGKLMNLKYCSVTHKIYGLTTFMRRYAILCNYMLLFTYTGNSKFFLTVYDPLCMDYLRNDDGFLMLEEFTNPTDGSYMIDLSSVSGTEIEDDSEEDEEVNSFSHLDVIVIEDEVNMATEINIIEPPNEEVDHFNPEHNVHVPHHGGVPDMNPEHNVIVPHHEGFDENVNAPMSFFDIILKKSHLHGRCHGAYIPRDLFDAYHNWRHRTTLTLRYNGREWNVEVLRNKRSCRFGIGWDIFMSDNSFAVGQHLLFTYIGDFGFEVQLVV